MRVKRINSGYLFCLAPLVTTRSQIEQTNKELKSHLGIEGSYFRKKEKNYGSVFVLCLVYNFIQ